MSLINDALKRAQEAQKKHSPPPLAGAPLHAAPESQRSAVPWMVGALVLIVLLVVGGAGLFLLLRERVSSVTIKLPKIQNVSSQKNVQPASVVGPPVTNISVATQLPVSTPPTPVALPPVATETTPKLPVSAIEVPPPQPAWPKLKLQGIIFVPRKPSVVINNKALFIGERVAGAQVVAITPENVTLVFAGQTNVLSAP